MVNSSFFADGGTYDTAVVTSNDHPASTSPSQAPSSFYPSGTTYNEADEVASANSASQAAASAAAALASQNAAHTSETNAGSSATAAANSATNSATSAAAALASQNAAHTSETNAAGSATAASGSASAASGSASAAAGSATAASGSASAAATSATNAHTSELNAATSATNAAAAVQSAAGTATPNVDGTATVGTSTKWAHEDHRHPTDTTRAPLNSPAFTGSPSAPSLVMGNATATFGSMFNITSLGTIVGSDWLVSFEREGNASNNESLIRHVHHSNFSVTGASPQPILSGFASRGTIATPAGVASGDYLLIADGRGHDGSVWSDTSAQMAYSATATWSATSHPSKIEFKTTPAGSTAPVSRLKILDNGGVSLTGTSGHAIGGTSPGLGWGLYHAGTISATSGYAIVWQQDATLQATANNDTLQGARITATPSKGAFTGVTSYGLYIAGGLATPFDCGIMVADSSPVYFGGQFTFKPPASITPVNNGDLTFEATSNTSLRLRYKGSDGVVRSATLTLS